MHDTRARRAFNRVWASQSASLVGRQIGVLAVAIVSVVELHAGPLAVGAIAAARYLPFPFLASAAGRLTDRMGRPKLLGACAATEVVVIGLMTGLLLFDMMTLVVLGLLVFVAGTLEMTYDIAYRTVLPELVDRSKLVVANAKFGAAESVAEAGGPGVGGAIVAAGGPVSALFGQVACHLLAAVTLVRFPALKRSVTSMRDDRERTDRLPQFGDPILRACAGEAATYNFFWQASLTLLVLYAVEHLQLGVDQIGLLLTVAAVGAAMGVLFAPAVGARIGAGRALLIGTGLSDVAPLAFLFAPAGPDAIWILGPALAIQGTGIALCNIHVAAIRQVRVPSRLLGRVTGDYARVTQSAFLAGSLLAGVVGDQLGVRLTFEVSCAALTTTWLWFWFSPLRGLSTVDDVQEATVH